MRIHRRAATKPRTTPKCTTPILVLVSRFARRRSRIPNICMHSIEASEREGGRARREL